MTLVTFLLASSLSPRRQGTKTSTWYASVVIVHCIVVIVVVAAKVTVAHLEGDERVPKNKIFPAMCRRVVALFFFPFLQFRYHVSILFPEITEFMVGAK